MAAKTVPEQNLFNRPLSAQQRAVLDVLPVAEFGDPDDGCVSIRHLPRTGDIIEALGREPTGAAYASVSRTLQRLVQAGLVRAFSGTVATQGNGYRYGRTPESGAAS